MKRRIIRLLPPEIEIQTENFPLNDSSGVAIARLQQPSERGSAFDPSFRLGNESLVRRFVADVLSLMRTSFHKILHGLNILIIQ